MAQDRLAGILPTVCVKLLLPESATETLGPPVEQVTCTWNGAVGGAIIERLTTSFITVSVPSGGGALQVHVLTTVRVRFTAGLGMARDVPSG